MERQSKKRIVIASNTSWYIVNFRANLIRALMDAGYEVAAIAPPDRYTEAIEKIGCAYRPIEMDNKGTSPTRDIRLLFDFYSLLKDIRADCFLGFTIKPNIYGSIAAHVLGVPVINNIAGLGAAFGSRKWLRIVASWLYRISLRRSYFVFFQNEDDRRAFVDAGLVLPERTARLPGSGIDTARFSPTFVAPPLDSGSPFRFLLVARLLWEKGIGEYVEAARRIRGHRSRVEFQILGFLNVANPGAISREQMDQWVSKGWVRYLGSADDVRPTVACADCIVLPSYYGEGVPRSILEAASMGKPVITTNSTGCRDVVSDGVTGFLVKPRDPEDLAEKMEQMIHLSANARRKMGLLGRERMLREFDERIVLSQYIEAVQEALGA